MVILCYYFLLFYTFSYLKRPFYKPMKLIIEIYGTIRYFGFPPPSNQIITNAGVFINKQQIHLYLAK